MFKVEALIQPCKLEQVCAALQVCKVSGILVTEARDHGASAMMKSSYRGRECGVAVPRTKVEVLVSSLQVDEVVEALVQTARTDLPADDGTVVLYQVADAIRIRNGQTISFVLS